jgi:hypothetical protein
VSAPLTIKLMLLLLRMCWQTEAEPRRLPFSSDLEREGVLKGGGEG